MLLWSRSALGAHHRAPDFNGDGFADLPIGIPFEDVSGAIDAGAVEVIYGSSNGLHASGDQCLTQNTSHVPSNARSGNHFGSSIAWGDFDGDGFDDIAIGVPQKDIGGIMNAGAVIVLYGSSNGLRSEGAQLWSQNSPGILDSSQASDFFGSSVASGDFNGDEIDDLAIGVPGETINGFFAAGAVNVIYGSPAGLQSIGNQFWSQDSANISNSPDMNDQFGEALAAGDFDRNGVDDLAIGVPGETLENFTAAGAVNVIYGMAGEGLNTFANQFWNKDSFGVPDSIDRNDVFGDSLAVGDFDGDEIDDLAIGIPGDDIGGVFQDEGSVVILYGRSTNGLGGSGAQFFSQDTSSIPGIPQGSDHFGLAIAAGDFDRDGFDDLAIGTPNDDFGSVVQCGTVTIIPGSATGLRAASSRLWSQSTAGVRDVAEGGDEFGAALLAGDFDGDGRDDLAIGVPGESVGNALGAGAVNVLYGSSDGLTADGNQFWNQNSPNINDASESADGFGQSLGGGPVLLPV